MAGDNERGALFRPIVPNQHSRVTYAELFFDLVFVFAVTQVSHTLLGRFTRLGALQTTLLFPAVWWVLVYTSWITNWLNPGPSAASSLMLSMLTSAIMMHGRGVEVAVAEVGRQSALERGGYRFALRKRVKSKSQIPA